MKLQLGNNLGYNANHIYDENGNAMAVVYRISQNQRVATVRADPTERAGVMFADDLISRWNSHVDSRATISKMSVRIVGLKETIRRNRRTRVQRDEQIGRLTLALQQFIDLVHNDTIMTGSDGRPALIKALTGANAAIAGKDAS